MFCSQCGKKVRENMLFCPFCGAEIVIPEQEENVAAESAEEKPVEQKRPEFAFEPQKESEPKKVEPIEAHEPIRQAPVAEFVPLDVELAQEKPFEDPKQEVEDEFWQPKEAIQLKGGAPDLTNVRTPKQTSDAEKKTYAPKKEFNPNDIFMDGNEPDYDAVDEYDYDDDDYDYEEPEARSFFMRHVRGLVALLMLVIVAAVVGTYLCLPAGQKKLAAYNLAWTPTAYHTIAYEYYQNGDYAKSASYFEKASDMALQNYNDANNAAIAYHYAGDKERALNMAKRAIGIDAAKPEAYQLIQQLYPDAAARPLDITELLRQGVQLTGDNTLAD